MFATWTVFVLLHTVPVLYEKYEDHVDAFAEKAAIELKKQYAVADEKFLSKIPRGPLKDKKSAWRENLELAMTRFTADIYPLLLFFV